MARVVLSYLVEILATDETLILCLWHYINVLPCNDSTKRKYD